MAERDTDIETLERLLGPAREDYRGLRHAPALRVVPIPRRRPVLRRLAVAATGLIVIGALGLTALDRAGFFTPQPALRFAMPSPLTAPLTLRPTGSVRLTLSTRGARPAGGFSVPTRPTPPGALPSPRGTRG
ncbi:MAG: hypothetical protein AAFN17_02040 [Pseudomonadota bacterium]